MLVAGIFGLVLVVLVVASLLAPWHARRGAREAERRRKRDGSGTP